MNNISKNLSTVNSRVSILDVCFITGYTIGNFCSAIVFEKLGFNGTFGISIGFIVFNFLYIYFFIDESRYVGLIKRSIFKYICKMLRKPSSDSTREGGNDFCRQLSGVFSAVFMTREGFSRSRRQCQPSPVWELTTEFQDETRIRSGLGTLISTLPAAGDGVHFRI